MCFCVYTLQKVFDIELIVFFEMKNFCVVQCKTVHIFGKSTVIVIPEYYLTDFALQLFVEFIGYLF